MLLNEVRLNGSKEVKYFLFWDNERNFPVITKADYIHRMLADGKLGAYNTINDVGDIKATNKQLINSVEVQTIAKHDCFVSDLNIMWLRLGVPCFSGVCILTDKKTHKDYVWCKVLMHTKYAKSLLHFFDMCMQVLSNKFTETPSIIDMESFVTTEDRKYVYSTCVMLSLEVLQFLMSEDSIQFLNDYGCVNIRNFLLDVTCVSTFDYLHANKVLEKPKVETLSTFVMLTKQHNTKILNKYTKTK